MTGKKIYWLTGAYILILLGALVLFFLAPNGKSTFQEMSQEEINKADQVFNEIFNTETPDKEKLDNLEGVYKKGELIFQYSENELEIAPIKKGMGIYNIFVERKETNDNTIQVLFYTTQTIINKYDVTEAMNPPRIYFTGKRLNIIAPEKTEIHVAMFNKEFTMVQFSDEKWFYYPHQRDIMGNDLIYIQIPKNVQILNDEQMGININYVRGK